ncbi:MAG: AAA family ATPase [Firmicutes bacterium]|nr:AAA family ATPase [Bacillota bacterium]
MLSEQEPEGSFFVARNGGVLLKTIALTAADSVIIPVQGQYLAAKGLEQLMRTIARVKRQINPHLAVDGIFIAVVVSHDRSCRSFSKKMSQDIAFTKVSSVQSSASAVFPIKA